jgi:hypothetical protein
VVVHPDQELTVRRFHPDGTATLVLTSAAASAPAADRLAAVLTAAATTDLAADRLAVVLAAAAATDLDDPAWHEVQQDAVATTRDLVDTGDLPHHLAVASQDPPVVAVRTIAAAWRHVTAGPAARDVRADRDVGWVRT